MCKGTVLVIEDNPMNLEMACELLEDAGFQAIPAEDGIVGVQRAQESLPDLILMDLHLPSEDGLEVTGILKNVPALNSTPIIAFTAMPLKEGQELAMTNGCSGIISKPIDITTFAETVENYLPRKQASDPDTAVKNLTFLGKQITHLGPAPESKNRFRNIAELHLRSLIVHDLKTPAQSLATALQVLQVGQVGPVTPEQRELLDEMAVTNNQLLTLLDNLYTTYLYGEGRFTLQYENCNLNDLLRKVTARKIEPLAHARKHQVILQLTEYSPELYIDPQEMERALCILADSALTGMREGSLLKLATTAEPEAANIILEDNGLGLHSDVLDWVFHPESKHRPGSRNAGVTLGLQLCKLIVEGHGGRITAESFPGSNRFRVRLPYRAASG